MSVKIEIKSRPGTFITLDEEVAEKIGHWGWCILRGGHITAYLKKSKPKKMVYLNQAVIWATTGEWPEKGAQIEYINGDKLDGRMENISVYVPNIIKIEGTSSVKIEIKSRPGTFITLDEDVAEKIGHWGWAWSKGTYVTGYLPGSGHKGKVIPLSHAVIWAATGKWPEKGMDVDHINHDLLDNRMENLRVVTKSVNTRNMNKHEGASSQLHGVSWNLSCQKWIAQAGVRIDGRDRHIYSSLTTDEVLAGKCADCMRDLIGGFLPRNFPDLTFQEKWKAIGEKQRRQIFHCMAKNNVPIHDNTIFNNWNFAA